MPKPMPVIASLNSRLPWNKTLFVIKASPVRIRSSQESFFLLASLEPAGADPTLALSPFAPPLAFPDCCFFSSLAPRTRPSTAVIVSLTSEMKPEHANCHEAMLMLPSGARGNDRTHST